MPSPELYFGSRLSYWSLYRAEPTRSQPLSVADDKMVAQACDGCTKSISQDRGLMLTGFAGAVFASWELAFRVETDVACLRWLDSLCDIGVKTTVDSCIALVCPSRVTHA